MLTLTRHYGHLCVLKKSFSPRDEVEEGLFDSYGSLTLTWLSNVSNKREEFYRNSSKHFQLTTPQMTQ